MLATGTRDGFVMVWFLMNCGFMEEFLLYFVVLEGYIIYVEFIIEDVFVEYGLLMENLFDLAYASFTYIGIFVKGWGVLNMVKFVFCKLRKDGDGWYDMGNFFVNGCSEGSWKLYFIDMKFLASCMVDSYIGLA